MTFLTSKSASKMHIRLISFTLFLAVFSLPLHFHPATARVQMVKECSCIHGTRMQTSLATQLLDWLPGLLSEPVYSELHEAIGSQFAIQWNIRAPPVTASL